MKYINQDQRQTLFLHVLYIYVISICSTRHSFIIKCTHVRVHVKETNGKTIGLYAKTKSR